jgi:hypothetical protein
MQHFRKTDPGFIASFLPSEVEGVAERLVVAVVVHLGQGDVQLFAEDLGSI